MFWNPLRWVTITKFPKKCLGYYCNPCFWWSKMPAHKIKSDFLAKKITFGFLAKSKKGHWTKIAKMGQKMVKIYFWLILAVFRQVNNTRSHCYVKKMTSVLLNKSKNCQSWTIIFFGNFLAHFCNFGPMAFTRLGQKTKSDFFGQKITFDLMGGHF